MEARVGEPNGHDDGTNDGEAQAQGDTMSLQQVNMAALTAACTQVVRGPDGNPVQVHPGEIAKHATVAQAAALTRIANALEAFQAAAGVGQQNKILVPGMRVNKP